MYGMPSRTELQRPASQQPHTSYLLAFGHEGLVFLAGHVLDAANLQTIAFRNRLKVHAHVELVSVQGHLVHPGHARVVHAWKLGTTN